MTEAAKKQTETRAAMPGLIWKGSLVSRIKNARRKSIRFSRQYVAAALMLAFALLLAACPKGPEESSGSEFDDVIDEVTNRISIPSEVRRNLGITFVKVEKRSVAATLRVPGRFEALPSARREYPTMLSGQITLLVKQYDQVEVDTPLYRISSPEWRKLQQELGAAIATVAELLASVTVLGAEMKEAESELSLFPARIDALAQLKLATSNHIETLRASESLWGARIKALELLAAKGGGKAAELTEARANLGEVLATVAEGAEKLAALDQSRVDLESEKAAGGFKLTRMQVQLDVAQAKIVIAERAFELALTTAAAATGLKIESLRSDDRWRLIDTITVYATAKGVIDHLDVTDGVWLEANSEVLGTFDPVQLRFRARALQSDLGILKAGQSAKIVPPLGGSLAQADSISGVVKFSLEADPDERTVDLLVTPSELAPWARPGVSAQLEIIVRESAEPEYAIPVDCVIRDGLDQIFFLRDREDPDKVIRMVASLGISDGRWIVVYRGVMTGDEVVQGGTYELKLTGSGKAGGGGHFHSDGTFHPAGTKH